MAPLPRLVPWQCWDEWRHVMQGLFSAEEAQRVWALEVVGLWRLRGRIPHSVDSTALLVEALLNDKSSQDDATLYRVGTAQRSESELRLSYSIIIVRAVNGLVDPSQQGYFADSVATLAHRIGLPGWFVELRHDATHQQLPSLSMLRTAARHLISWYQDNYWQPQLEFLQCQTALVDWLSLEHETSDDNNVSAPMNLSGLKETTFLTNTFMPALLRWLSFASEKMQAIGSPDNFKRIELEKWSRTLAVVLKQSIHAPLGATNTIICQVVAVTGEVLARGGNGTGNVDKFTVELLVSLLQTVVYALQDVLNANSLEINSNTSKNSARGDTKCSDVQSSSSIMEALSHNLELLGRHVSSDKLPLVCLSTLLNCSDLEMSASLPTACAWGLQHLDEIRRSHFLKVVGIVLIVYGKSLFERIRCILLEENVCCHPFTATPSMESCADEKVKTIKRSRIQDAMKQSFAPGTQGSVCNEPSAIDHLRSVRARTYDKTMPETSSSDDDDTSHGREEKSKSGKIWPVGMLWGNTAKKSSSLYLLEEL